MSGDERATPLRRGGLRNSWQGGWRHIAFYVEHLDGWWWRRKWAVKMDYSDDLLGSTRGQVCSRHRTVEEANAELLATWDGIEADHERIQAYEAEERPGRQMRCVEHGTIEPYTTDPWWCSGRVDGEGLRIHCAIGDSCTFEPWPS